MLFVSRTVPTNRYIPVLQAGRPRPDFMARCWPDGAAVKWNADGTPACSLNSIRPEEGRKSFPSGARFLRSLPQTARCVMSVTHLGRVDMCICTGLLLGHGRTATCSSSETSNIVWLY